MIFSAETDQHKLAVYYHKVGNECFLVKELMNKRTENVVRKLRFKNESNKEM